MDNTDRVSRESTSSSRGFIWPWNDITTRRFQGNRSICLRTDSSEMVYDRSHHMCQNLICQQFKWQHIRPDLFPRTLFSLGIMHGHVRGLAALQSRRNNISGINAFLCTPETLSGPSRSARDLGASGRPLQTNPMWHVECLGRLRQWGVQSSHH